MRYVKRKELILIVTLFLLLQVILQIFNVRLVTQINSVFWILIIYYLYRNSKNNYTRLSSRFYLDKMVIISILYILIYFNLGFVFGFSKSHFSHTFSGILSNFFEIIIPIIGIEYFRNIVINKNRSNKLIIWLVTIILILFEIKFNMLLSNFDNKEQFFKYICSIIFPLIANSILYSYLTLKGPCIIVLVFRLLERVSILLLPIVPSLDWFMTGALGIITPVLIYLLIKYKLSKQEAYYKGRTGKKDFNKVSYVIAITLSVFVVSFMLGLFKYEPIAILSDSMVPTYSRGDIVVYEKLSSEELKNIRVGEIIVYKIGNQNIAHRIINVDKGLGSVFYQTMGDNNNDPDLRKVTPDQIMGVYVFSMRYIGFPSVWLNDYFSEEKAKVETK